MIYQSVSVKNIIGRAIRNTGIQDSTFIHDMKEWIPEAMGYMRTKTVLASTFKDVEISFHKGKLPCNLYELVAVTHKGYRLREGNGMRAFPGVTLPLHPSMKYTVEMGFINTPFPDGKVRLFYTAQPTDAEGYLLVPDNEDYKEALYYYIRAKMIGAGFHDTVFSEEKLMERFEKHAVRAIGSIRYPSVDSMERKVTSQVRFMPPQDFFESFFEASEEGGYPTDSILHTTTNELIIPEQPVNISDNVI